MAESANKEVVGTEAVDTVVETTETKTAEAPAKKEKSAKKDKAPKKSWLKGLKSEFKKIMWPYPLSLSLLNYYYLHLDFKFYL